MCIQKTVKISELPPSQSLAQKMPVSEEVRNNIAKYRKTIVNILSGKDKRMLLISGPCSIHSPDAALRYARKLKALSELVSDHFFVVMRVYFEKPRTTTGWKGLIYDPDLNGDCNIEKGLTMARKLLIEISEIGIPAATELLDPITAVYYTDLVSWAGIGARTTESQTHRQFVSSLSFPVGFKNSSDGNVQVAVDGVCASNSSHSYIGLQKDGRCEIVRTTGNPYSHLVLRGSMHGVNYDAVSIAEAKRKLGQSKAHVQRLIVDCSHGNSNKDYTRQSIAFEDVMRQCRNGERAVAGIMLESNIKAGKQPFSETPDPDISVTDGCISFEETRDLVIRALQKMDSPQERQAKTSTVKKIKYSGKKVAFLGPDGTFSQLASQKHFGMQNQYLGHSNVNEIFRSVIDNAVDYGCVPIENSSEGVVTQTLDLLMQYPLKITDEVVIPIRQCLLGREGMPIHKIYCHAQTKGQCRGYLSTKFPNVQVLETESNALAAQFASREVGAAAIGCESAAELYKLDILEENVADSPNNSTRFIIISHDDPEPTLHDKTSICFCLSDRTGALCECLKAFQHHDVTLTMIESRPSRKKKWEYLFYADLLGNFRDKNVSAAIRELNDSVSFVKLLGSYPAA